MISHRLGRTGLDPLRQISRHEIHGVILKRHESLAWRRRCLASAIVGFTKWDKEGPYRGSLSCPAKDYELPDVLMFIRQDLQTVKEEIFGYIEVLLSQLYNLYPSFSRLPELHDTVRIFRNKCYSSLQSHRPCIAIFQ